MKKIILVLAVLFVGLLSTTNLRAQSELTDPTITIIDNNATVPENENDYLDYFSISIDTSNIDVYYLGFDEETNSDIYIYDLYFGTGRDLRTGLYNSEGIVGSIQVIESNISGYRTYKVSLPGPELGTVYGHKVFIGGLISTGEHQITSRLNIPPSIISGMFDGINALVVAFIAIMVSLFTNIAGVFYDPLTGINWFTTLLILPVALTFTYYAFGFITRLLKRLF